MRELLVCLAIVVGTFFMFVASFGLVRLPDFFLRVHAPTKAATLGLLALIAALLGARPDIPRSIGLLAALFIGVTVPISAHVLMRAAHRQGMRPHGSHVDEHTATGGRGEP